jgi:hypothetical protein
MLQMVARIVQYPIVLIVAHVPNVWLDISGLLFGTASPYWLLMVTYIATSMQGILVSAVFWFDPTVQRSVLHTKQQLVFEYLENEQKNTTMDEWGLDLVKGEQPVSLSRYHVWRSRFIGFFLVKEADRAELRRLEKEAQESKLFTPSLAEPEQSFYAEKVRTYELEIGALGADDLDDEEDSEDAEYWETVQLHL